MTELRILIIADDTLTRAGLAALLSEQLGYQVVGQIGSDMEVASSILTFRPDVLLWDLGWNPTSSLEQLGEIAANASPLAQSDPAPEAVPILALIPNEEFADRVLTADIQGLLLYDASPERLVAALHALSHGLFVLDPTLSCMAQSLAEPFPTPLIESLTSREQEVLHQMAQGLSNKAIARKLQISEHTVKFHVNAILGKLEASSRTEAVVRATKLGLILL